LAPDGGACQLLDPVASPPERGFGQKTSQRSLGNKCKYNDTIKEDIMVLYNECSALNAR